MLKIQSEERANLVKIRRHLHANPELSFDEHQTAAFIKDELKKIGLVGEPCAGTGVIAVLEGSHPGPTLALRADIDALPIQEEGEIDYISTRPGVMHACGHDVHTTVGIGVARQLIDRREEIHGRIKFIFQPAEEASPEDEPIGAARMVVEGALENPKVDAVFAFHVMPTLQAGKIGFTGGAVWAGSDLIEISVVGKKTHAAYPHEGVDAVVIAAHIVTALQSVTSRRVDARKAVVISIGHLEAGNSYNIIADSAQLTGILRSLSEETSTFAQEEIRRIATHVALAMGGSAEVRFTPGARLTENNPVLERKTVSILRRVLGDDLVVPHEPQLGAEDFAAFSTQVPGCYLFLGVRNEPRGIVHMIHTPFFDVDEDCLPLGVEAMSTALIELGQTWEQI